MTFQDIIDALDCTILYKGHKFDTASIKHVAAGDLMSEVLVVDEENLLVVTHLTSDQVIRTSDIVDAEGILLVNSKAPQPSMRKLAADFDMVLLTTPLNLFECCAALSELLREKGS